MTYKNPEDKAAWQRANKEKVALYKERWLAGPAGQAYLAKQKEKREAQKNINAERRASEKILRKEETKKQRSAKDRRYRKKQRESAIQILGGACKVCGMDDQDVLEFDHILPLLRRSSGHKIRDVYKEVLRHPSPQDDFQLLCANCHTKKTRMNNEYGFALPPG